MSDDYTNVLPVELRDQNKAVLEAVGSMQERFALTALQTDLAGVKQDVKTIKAGFATANAQGNDHETRRTHLEAAV